MTQEEKELLIRDLCGRLPYGVKASSLASHLEINTIDGYFVDGDGRKMFHLSEPDFWQAVEDFQYYLRPMSSMTKKEEKEIQKINWQFCKPKNDLDECFVGDADDGYCSTSQMAGILDYLNAHHFDYHRPSLISLKLVKEATKGMYK